MDRYERTVRTLRRLIVIVLAVALTLGISTAVFAKYTKMIYAGSFTARIEPSLYSENLEPPANDPPGTEPNAEPAPGEEGLESGLNAEQGSGPVTDIYIEAGTETEKGSEPDPEVITEPGLDMAGGEA